MKGFVGVTDNEWFIFLSKQPEIDEVNFWQPGGKSLFKSLKPGEPFFFKLHSPLNFIVGGGFFAHSSILPVSLAWQAFQKKNGAPSYFQMRRLIGRKRNVTSQFEDYKIGCIILVQPFFFDRQDWLPIPPDFSLNIVQGKTYDLTQGHGLYLWQQVQEKLMLVNQEFSGDYSGVIDPAASYGSPILVKPRLGQGSFRVMVTDAYQRRCAITREKTLPALEAAHIRPFSEEGPHRIDNGLLLRSDIHRLFDSGYVTITPDHHFEVSRRIKDEFDNGKEYEKLHGGLIHVPQKYQDRPSPEFLEWHNEKVFRG